jgi:hypothetical protein
LEKYFRSLLIDSKQFSAARKKSIEIVKKHSDYFTEYKGLSLDDM